MEDQMRRRPNGSDRSVSSNGHSPDEPIGQLALEGSDALDEPAHHPPERSVVSQELPPPGTRSCRALARSPGSNKTGNHGPRTAPRPPKSGASELRSQVNGKRAARLLEKLVCECGHQGYLRLSEGEQPSPALWETYVLEGFDGKSLTVTRAKNMASDVLGYMRPTCPSCGRSGKSIKWAQAPKRTRHAGNS